MPEITASKEIVGVQVVQPDVHRDERGRFVETYRREWFPQGREMIQGNCCDRQQGTVVGLHYHRNQSDYWYVPSGAARVALFDLRNGSPTRSKAMYLDLGNDNDRGVFIPPGVGHGFAALTDMTITYLVDQYYNPDDELGVAWDDPDMGLDWKLQDPILSPRDLKNPRVKDLDPDKVPVFA